MFFPHILLLIREDTFDVNGLTYQVPIPSWDFKG